MSQFSYTRVKCSSVDSFVLENISSRMLWAYSYLKMARQYLHFPTCTSSLKCACCQNCLIYVHYSYPKTHKCGLLKEKNVLNWLIICSEFAAKQRCSKRHRVLRQSAYLNTEGKDPVQATRTSRVWKSSKYGPELSSSRCYGDGFFLT